MRTWALQAHGLPTHGINREAAFALLPHEADPLFKHAWAPIERWIAEVWDTYSTPIRGNPLPKKTLANAFRFTNATWLAWKNGKGPLHQDPATAARWGASCAGWDLTGRTTMTDIAGNTYDLTSYTPRHLKTLYKKDWRKNQARMAWEGLGP